MKYTTHAYVQIKYCFLNNNPDVSVPLVLLFGAASRPRAQPGAGPGGRVPGPPAGPAGGASLRVRDAVLHPASQGT